MQMVFETILNRKCIRLVLIYTKCNTGSFKHISVSPTSFMVYVSFLRYAQFHDVYTFPQYQ